MNNILDRRATERENPEQKLQKQFARERELNDLRAIMQTESGRRFVWRLLSIADIYAPSFTGNSETFYREGRRSIGLVIFKDLHLACYNEYRKMEDEAASEQQGQRETKNQGLS